MTGPSFIAFVHDAGDEALVDEIAAPRRPAHIRRLDLAEGRLTLCLWSPAGDQVGQDGPILVDVNGTRSTAKVPVPARFVAADAAANDMSARASQFHSYLFLDSRNRAAVWTDHVGFSKIFHAVTGAGQILSDDLSVFAALNRPVDAGMIASYLINGTMLENRTLYDGVRCLAPATVAVVTPDGVRERPYWRFEPGVAPNADVAAIRAELWARAKVAVPRHVGGHDVVLPLSGGYDSACVLGALAEARHDMRAFSFSIDNPRPGSDADVARRQADLLKIEHQFVPIDTGSFLGMLKTNVSCGLDMRNANYEISAYARAAEIYRARFKDPLFCFGEQSFGVTSYRLNGYDDLLGSIELKSPKRLSTLAPAVGSATAGRLRAELDRVYGTVIDGLPAGISLFDACDRLRFSVRIGMNFAPLRTYTAGSFVPFACPLLDIGLLDLMRSLSSESRLEKSLFTATVRQNLPELLSIPRARFDQALPDLASMVRAEAGSIRDYIGALRVGIPGVMTPAQLHEFFQSVHAPRSTSHSPASLVSSVKLAARGVVKAVLASGYVPGPLKTRLRLRTYNKFAWGPDPVVLFQRALQLAMTFERLHTGRLP